MRYRSGNRQTGTLFYLFYSLSSLFKFCSQKQLSEGVADTVNQWRKGIASWKVGKTLYQSIPFTWLLPEAEKQAKEHKGPVIAGGPAIKLMGANWAETPDTVPYDTLSFHNPLATFTTRGCPNHCSFCAVPKIEGELKELDSWKSGPVICDNNLLASTRKHFEKVIDSLMLFSTCDFNQGLDARLFTSYHADRLARLKKPHIRFSWDSIKTEQSVTDAVNLCKKYGFKDIGIYVLLGFKDTPEDAHYRLEKVRSWGLFPNPMRYQPLDTLKKNSYIGPAWTEKELLKTMKYYYRLGWVGNACSYEDFDYLKHENQLQGTLF